MNLDNQSYLNQLYEISHASITFYPCVKTIQEVMKKLQWKVH